MKKTFTWITRVVTVFLVGLLVYVFVAAIVAKQTNTYINLFGYSTSRVATGSMEDKIPQGSYIIFKKQNFDLIVNDINNSQELSDFPIIVFRNLKEQINVVHRAIKVNLDGTLLTKGDNNTSVDSESVSNNNYIGTVLKVINVSNSKMGSTAFFIVIVVVVLLILTKEVFSIIFILKQEKDKQKTNEIDDYIAEERKKMLEDLIKEIDEDTIKNENDDLS